ncbi:MAG: endo alpha-1,4 polygalactosaminidase [Demequina sp.]|jgi:hypothetical protein|nr:endo alpha-1,4 polygalactosaminidase [Demequina sp.]
MRRRLAVLSIVGAMALSLAACSGPDPTLSSPQQPTSSPTATAPTASATAQSSTTPSATPSGSSSPSASASPAPSKGDKPSSKPKPTKPSGSSNASGHWKPKAGLTWQWQLSGKLDTSVNAKVYDVDLYDISAAQVKALHDKGRKVICYFSAGSYESGRPDSGDFPAAVKGKKMEGWPEYWLDIRDPRVLKIMAARMDLCAKKGFDGVEADNVDAYDNESGFDLTASDQLKYNKALAKLAHARGLAIGLKNDLEQVSALQPSFDFAVNEECYAYDECSVLKAFINAGKPVFHVEYEVSTSEFCPTTTKLGFSSMLKDLDLDASRTPC